MGSTVAEAIARFFLRGKRTGELTQPYNAYNAPVGNVINAETVFVGCSKRSAENAGAPAPHSVEAAIMLLDRRHHLDVLHARIKRCIARGVHRRLLVVVAGTQKDLPEVFVTRCGNIELKKSYDLQGGWRFLGQFHWPKEACDISALLDTIIVDLDMPTLTSIAELQRYLENLKISVCFSHYIEETDLDASSKLVYEWIDYFASAWPSPRSGRLVVAFLCIETEPAGSSRANGLLTRIADQYSSDDCPILVLPPLEVIVRNDVREWERVVRQSVGEAWANKLQLDVGGIFEKNLEWRFEDLSRELRNVMRLHAEAMSVNATTEGHQK
jgi:hypothetical protein